MTRNIDMLIQPEALHARLGEPGLRILDVRPGERFAMGHLPGARHFSVYGINTYDTDEAPLASFTRMWAFQLSLRGLSANDTIVVYEDSTGMSAARAFWFIEYLGHERVAVLDGGLRSWRAAGFEVERDAETPTAASFEYAPVRERVATWRDVLAAIDSPQHLVLDTRRLAEYLGEDCSTLRCGTVPGAVHLEWVHHLSDAGRMKDPAALRGLFESKGVTPDREIVALCNTGYRSAHAYLALRLLGYPRVRNYVGSWQEWGNRDGCPVVRPPAP
jgi:thiosulfate/3-mercaptopyruvate sulfurtransferase